MLRYCFPSASLGWPCALLLGAILAATDPVAVVNALKQLHAPDKLESLIKGESLLNDGSAVVLFFVFLDVAAAAQTGDESMSAGSVITFFFRMALGGPAVGVGIGMLCMYLIRKTRDRMVETIVMLAAVFGSFFVAEHPKLHVSGVLA